MIPVTHLFAILDQKLVELLRSLEPDDWNKRTLAKQWSVKDVAAHLLDGNLRALSFSRDQHTMPPVGGDIHSYDSLVGFLNRLNAEWVLAAKRLSPQVLTDLLETSGKEYTSHMQTQDLTAQAVFAVGWAGETVSQNWFHIAREYTEKWHHQQQIREAVDKPGIITKELFYPVMDTFMCGLPHTYRNTLAEDGTVLQITIDTENGGNWYLVRKQTAWQLSKQPEAGIHASLLMQPGTAWKLFTKGISPAEARKEVVIHGDESLASVALSLVAVMA